MNIPSWIEDNTSPLGQLANFVAAEERHDFDAGLVAAQAERVTRWSSRRGRLSGEALGAFNELLAITQVANFAWWNEEHNYYIDLRATIPMRDGVLAIGREVGADKYDDALFLFFCELLDAATAVPSGPTCSRWSPIATTTTTVTKTNARRCRRSSARCRRRSKTPF